MCDTVTAGTTSDDVTLDNPSPVALGTTAVFTCSATVLAIVWVSNATSTTIESSTGPAQVAFRTSTLSILALRTNNNTFATCITLSPTFPERTEILQIYGQNSPLLSALKCISSWSAGPPSEPVGLSSELSPVAGSLVLNWSPPWAPDGVQLHYTVTVTNTNSTSTTTITMFNTSSTTITISRDNITTSAGSSECDQYVWSVTAINPAGSSLPTNSTTPVSFVTGLSI